MPINSPRNRTVPVSASVVKSAEFRMLTITPTTITSVFSTMTTVDGVTVSEQPLPPVVISFDSLPQAVQNHINSFVAALSP